jgi:hypothetical protein
MGRDAIQAEDCRDKHAISIITPHILSPIFSEASPRNKGKLLILRLVGHDEVWEGGGEVTQPRA